MTDVALYGNLDIDTILDNGHTYTDLGSIANVWQTLTELDPTMDVGLSPTDIGETLVYVDRTAGKRYFKHAKHNTRYQAKIFQSKIHHLMYLNKISDTSFIHKLDGIVTADLCPGTPVDKKLLKHVDFLFFADEDVNNDFEDYVKATKGWCIQHHSTGSTYSNGQKIKNYNLPKNKILNSVNVLGAGDCFASVFIKNIIDGQRNIDKLVSDAHIITSSRLAKL